MKISLIQTGKTRSEYLKEGIKEYQKRLKKYLNIEEFTIPDLKNTKNLPVEIIKTREGNMILKNCKTTDFVILLDENGKSMSSVEWADFLKRKMDIGKDVVMITGGAFGFSKEVYARADGIISLSKMTFSHQLIRLILAEQLYRAMTIIKGDPYHHS